MQTWPLLNSEIGVSLVSGFIGAVVGAVVTARYQQRENRRLTTVHVLTRINDKLPHVLCEPVTPLRDQILAYYKTPDGSAVSLSSQACQYLALLTELEFVYWAIADGLIEGHHARRWLRDHLAEDRGLKEFLLEFRIVTKSSSAFEFMLKALNDELRKKPVHTLEALSGRHHAVEGQALHPSKART